MLRTDHALECRDACVCRSEFAFELLCLGISLAEFLLHRCKFLFEFPGIAVTLPEFIDQRRQAILPVLEFVSEFLDLAVFVLYRVSGISGLR